MASNIIELFGYSPTDQSPAAKKARKNLECPFLGQTCTKTLSDGTISGMCTLKPMTSGPVICCPVRLYAEDYKVLKDVAVQVFGKQKGQPPDRCNGHYSGTPSDPIFNLI